MDFSSQQVSNRSRAIHVNIKGVQVDIPLLAEIEVHADDYGLSHKFVLQFMIEHSVVSRKRFYLAFIHHFVRVVLQRDLRVVSKMDVSKQDLERLSEAIMTCCNKEVQSLGIHLVSHTREEDNADLIVLSTELGFSEELSAISGFSQDEMFLITRMLTEMMQTDGSIPLNWLLDEAASLPNPVSALKAQNLLERLCSAQWLKLRGGYISIEPRALVELSILLRTRCHALVCTLCRAVIVKRSEAVPCGSDSCESHLHARCWETFSANIGHDAIGCPASGCTGTISKEEVRQALEEARQKALDAAAQRPVQRKTTVVKVKTTKKPVFNVPRARTKAVSAEEKAAVIKQEMIDYRNNQAQMRRETMSQLVKAGKSAPSSSQPGGKKRIRVADSDDDIMDET